MKKEKYPLHPIDKNGNYTKEEMERFMIFCLLDRATPYATVCKSFDALDKENLTNRKSLKNASKKQIGNILKSVGYRFHTTGAEVLKRWSNNPINIETSTRDEMVDNIYGFGYKLASMFLRNTRGINFAVIDTHTKKWLREQGIESSNYKTLENSFLEKCHELGKDPYVLDMEIWEERRI